MRPPAPLVGAALALILLTGCTTTSHGDEEPRAPKMSAEQATQHWRDARARGFKAKTADYQWQVRPREPRPEIDERGSFGFSPVRSQAETVRTLDVGPIEVSTIREGGRIFTRYPDAETQEVCWFPGKAPEGGESAMLPPPVQAIWNSTAIRALPPTREFPDADLVLGGTISAVGAVYFLGREDFIGEHDLPTPIRPEDVITLERIDVPVVVAIDAKGMPVGAAFRGDDLIVALRSARLPYDPLFAGARAVLRFDHFGTADVPANLKPAPRFLVPKDLSRACAADR